MGIPINSGLQINSREPADTRIVHDGRPWTNPAIAVSGTNTFGYDGLIAIDTSDDTVWLLTNAAQSGVQAGWQEIGPVGEDFINTTNQGTDNQVLSLQVDGNNRTLEWVNQATGGGVPSGDSLPDSTANPAPAEGDLFYLTRQDTNGHPPGLYAYDQDRNSVLEWAIVGPAFRATGTGSERIEQISYDNDTRRFFYSASDGLLYANDASVLTNGTLVTGTPDASDPDGLYAILTRTTGQSAGVGLALTVKTGGTSFAQPPNDFARLTDEIIIFATNIGNNPNTPIRISGVISAISRATLGRIVLTLDGFTVDNEEALAGSVTIRTIISAPSEGIFIRDGEGVVQPEHHSIRFTGAEIIERNAELNINTEAADFRTIRSTGATNHGEFVTLNSDGTFTTARVGTGPGGGVTEDEVQRDIREYTDPRFVTSSLVPTFTPRDMDPNAFLNANREDDRFTTFRIHRIQNISSNQAVMSFETSLDALAFAADITGNTSIANLLSGITVSPNATTAEQWEALRNSNDTLTLRRPTGDTSTDPLQIVYTLNGERLVLTFPLGHTFLIGNPSMSTGASRAASGNFFVSFTVPAEDTDQLTPNADNHNIYGLTSRGRDGRSNNNQVVTFQTDGSIGGGSDVHFAISQGDIDANNLRVGSQIRFRNNERGFPNFGFDVDATVIHITNPTSNDVLQWGGLRGPLDPLNRRLVRVRFERNNNNTGSVQTLTINNSALWNYNVLSHVDRLPDRFLVNSSNEDVVATVSQPGLPSRQYVDFDGIAYDGGIIISGPNANEIHWVSAITANIVNAERLYAFQYDTIPMEGVFPAQMTSGGGTFNTTDLHVVVNQPPNNGIGRDSNGNSLFRYHGSTTSQLRNFLLGQDVARTRTGSDASLQRHNVNLLDVGNLTGTQTSRADGQIQAFFSRQAGGGTSETMRDTTERVQYLAATRTNATIDGVAGVALSITSQGDTTDADSAYGTLRTRLDVIRSGSNPQSATTDVSALRGLQLGVSNGATVAGCQLTGIIITDNNGDNIQNAGATAPLFDVVNNWRIERHNGNWVWFYTGSAPLMDDYHYEFTYVYRRPGAYFFISSDGPNVVNTGDNPTVAAQRLYPTLTGRSYLSRFVRLGESDVRLYTQGDVSLGQLGGTIQGELREDIPLGTGTLGDSGLYVKTVSTDVVFNQSAPAATFTWSDNVSDGGQDFFVDHTAETIYTTGAGTTGSTVTAGTAPRATAPSLNIGGGNSVPRGGRFAVILALGSGSGSASRPVTTGVIRAFGWPDEYAVGAFDSRGLVNRQGNEIVLRFSPADPDGFLLVGVGRRVPSEDGFGQNQLVMEVESRQTMPGGARAPHRPGNLNPAGERDRIQQNTNDHVGHRQVLASNGFALFRYSNVQNVGNGNRGEFTEVILPATTGSIHR